jgi:peptide-methionine (R)-S-oxide reductase
MPRSGSLKMQTVMQQSRRQFLFIAGTGASLIPIWAWAGKAAGGDAMSDKTFPIDKTDEQWQRELTPEQFKVLRGHGTERALTSPLNNEKRAGTFVCAGCGNRLFAAETKFDSGTGWPSFYQPLDGGVGTSTDRSWFMVRTEVHCARCGGHLGHVFEDGPQPTGLRYCMNGVAMTFEPETK